MAVENDAALYTGGQISVQAPDFNSFEYISEVGLQDPTAILCFLG
jgi:hypothetical protein